MDVGADLGEGAEGGRLVEVAGEADFVACLGIVLDDPGVGRVGQDFAADEGLDAAVLQQGDLLVVAQLAVGLVFDDSAFSVDWNFVASVERVGRCLAGFVDFFDDWRGGFIAPTDGGDDLLELGSGELDAEGFQGALHLFEKEIVVGEEVSAEGVAQFGGCFHQHGVPFPCARIEQFLFLLFGEAGGTGAGVFLGVVLVGFSPIIEEFFEFLAHGDEVLEEGVAELVVQGGADVLLSAGIAQGFDALAGELAVEAQRALDFDFPISEGGIGEDFRLRGFFKGQERVADALDVLGRKFAVLFAHVFPQRAEPLGGIDELDFALAVLWLAIGEHPDVGGDAGVVEEIERQGDDGLQPVVLDDPAADVALALPGIAGEEGRAIVHLGDAAAQRGVVLHLAEHVGQEEHLAIAGAGEEREIRLVGVLDDEARVSDVLFSAHALEVAFPAFPVGWVGEHEVELAGAEGVVGKRAVLGAADDVIGGIAIAFEQEVGLADGVGLGVDFLAVEVGGDLLAVVFGDLLEGFLGHGEHAAGAAGAVVEEVGARLDLVGDGQEHELGHEPDGIAGRPVLAGFLVVVFVEAADQLLEHRAHGMVVEAGLVAHRGGAEVDVLIEEFLDELAEDIGFREAGDLIAKLEIGQDVLHIWRKAVEVGGKIVAERLLGGAGLEVAQEKGGGVVECLPGGGAEGVLLIGHLLAVERGFHVHDGLFRRLQHGIEAAQNGHRQDDIAIFSPHIHVAQDIVSDVPDEIGEPVELSLVHKSECEGVIANVKTSPERLPREDEILGDA